jgi:2-polyprenyl-3-methyl-5-hydroxy-6-metoxy-1,4-benzoquinol methylase
VDQRLGKVIRLSRNTVMATGEAPTFDFDAIMERIRAEARRRRALRFDAPTSPGADTLTVVKAPDLEQVDASLQAAEHVADVGVRLPPMHRQRGLKRRLAAAVAKAFLRLGEIVNRDQRLVNHSLINALRSLGLALQDQTRKFDANLGMVEAKLGTATKELEGLVVKEGQALRATLSETSATLRNEQQALEAMLSKSIAQERANQLLQDRRMSTLLEAIGRQSTSPPGKEQRATVAEEQAHMLDALYVEFEDAYRGTREDIKQRARAYMLEPVKEAGAGTPERPILDVGCGRGEWLEVLSEAGLEARGVDLNRAFVQECRDRKLHVEEQDALTYLKRLPDGCLGAVTAIHLLEHLPHEMLIGILDEARRVLQPGGLVIFETPNPTNLTVGARDFYLDPTHRNPLHPETMRFLAERRGLVRVSVLPLHPSPTELRVPDDGTLVTRRFNELFYGPRDYAILGYRA